MIFRFFCDLVVLILISVGFTGGRTCPVMILDTFTFSFFPPDFLLVDLERSVAILLLAVSSCEVSSSAFLAVKMILLLLLTYRAEF